MIETRAYKNASGIPPGRYQNSDISGPEKIFAKVDGSSIYLVNSYTKLQKEKLSRDIYFKPSYFPLSDPSDYSNSSCFSDWIVPTASFIFDVNGDEVVVSVPDHKISIDQYLSHVYDSIDENIARLYKDHPFVYFHYSGGVDSVVILSFLIKNNLLHKTKLLLYQNLPDIHNKQDDWVYYDNLLKSVDLIKNNFLSIVQTKVTTLDVVNLANSSAYDIFSSYSTSTLMYRYSDGPHLTGHYGNQSLLHMHIFVDSVLMHGGSYEQYQTMAKDPNIYSKNHVVDLYQINKRLVPIPQKHLLARSRFLLSLTPPYLHFPLMNNEIARNLRQLDFSQVTFDHLLNATIAKSIISNNVGTMFDSNILSDGSDGDNLSNFTVPFRAIHPKLLEIDKNLNHNHEGVEWHRYEIDQAKKLGVFSINTLTSLKAFEHLSSLVSGTETTDIIFDSRLYK